MSTNFFAQVDQVVNKFKKDLATAKEAAKGTGFHAGSVKCLPPSIWCATRLGSRRGGGVELRARTAGELIEQMAAFDKAHPEEKQ